MKHKLLALALIGALIGGAVYTTAIAQQAPSGGQLLGWRYNGTPEAAVTADKGSFLTDASSANFYFKTTDGTNTGWKQFNGTTLGGAFSGTAVLVSGSLTVTNSAFATVSSPAAFVSSTNASFALAGVVSGTVLTLTSATNSDVRTVTYLIIGR